MIEVSTIFFTLMIEGFVALLAIILVMLFLQFKCKRQDKDAAKKLVEQIKQQSKVRLENTGSFLVEKYRFEGNELEKAIKKIDKAEKKFIQRIINVYLKREAEGIVSMDAWVAELIEAYKDLSPVMPDAETLAGLGTGNDEQTAALTEELESLQQANEKLAEELTITKETMTNMVAEFGNMFGGGKEHQLENDQVIEKVSETIDEDGIEGDEETAFDDALPAEQIEEQPITGSTTNDDLQLDEAIDSESKDSIEAEESIEDILMSAEPEHEELMEEFVKDEASDEKDDDNKDEGKKKEQAMPEELYDEGIDDLIEGIDLSEDH